MCLAYPVRVVSVEPDDTATTDGPPALRRVPLVVVSSGGERIAPGDWLLVQNGLAVARISAEEAVAQRQLLALAVTNEGDHPDDGQ